MPARTRAPSEKRSRKRASVPARNRSRVITDQALWLYAGRLGGGLTPAQVSAIIREADTGTLERLMDLANECRQKDAHLQAVLSVSEESIAGLQWDVTTPEGARSKDKRAAKWVKETLQATPGLQKLIAYLAGAVYYGFDVNEILWKKEGGRLVPADFAHLSHRRFGYRPGDGRFVLRDQGSGTGANGVDFLEQYPNKFVCSHPRVNGDAPQREGLCRVLIWMTTMRTWTISDWLRTAELSWKPWRIGKFNQNPTRPEDRDEFEDVLDRLSTTGWALLPESVDLKVEWPGGSQTAKETHARLVDMIAQEQSKAVLGQTETTQSSSSSGYAQAKVHEAVRKDLLEARARQVARDITRDLIRPMIELNFSGVRVPRFEFITKDAVDLKAFSEAVSKLVEAAVPIPLAWVYDQSGIPAPKAGDETIGGADTEDPDDDTEEPNGSSDADESDDDTEEPPADGDE